MKKTLKAMLAIMIAAFTFASCADVPMPYELLAGDEGELEGAEGSGTLEDPYNAIAAINILRALGSGGTISDNVYVKGIVSSIKENYDGSHGNAEFNISVDGKTKNQFTVYRALFFNNEKWTGGPVVNIGDEVVICGKITMHGTTPETVSGEAYLYSLNGETSYEAETLGTADNPKTVAEALVYINDLNNKETGPLTYVKGKVVRVKEILSNKLTYYISDDGKDANTIQVYLGLGLDKAKFNATTDLAAGDEVIVLGSLYKYGTTPEIAEGSYLISLVKGEPSGNNLLVNGDFEKWTNGQPDNWKSTSSAGNATLTQSTDARNGSYSVSVGFTASQAKRMAYKEITLKAGTYKFSYYAKATTGDKSQTRAGWVNIVDGAAKTYKQGSWTTLSNTEWTEASVTFTLTEQTTVCLLAYNPQTSDYAVAQNILVDDASLVTSDGGIVEEGGGGGESGNTYTLATSFAAGKYIIAANNNGTYEVANPLSGSYGWIQKTDVTPSGNTISTAASNEFTFTATTGGYTIQDANGKYYYMKDTYNNFNVSETMPTEGHVWTVTINSDNTATITNVLKSKTIQYYADKTSYGAYSDVTYTLPSLFKK